MDREKFVYVSYIAAPLDKIWQALLEGELTRQYWRCEQQSAWTPGAHWQLVSSSSGKVLHVGKVLEFLPQTRLAVTWADPEDADDETKHSRMVIELEALAAMVRLTVTHDELTPSMRQKITYGWPRVLCGLKSFLETGHPLDIWA